MPRLLDLFCGAGGAAVGYSRAGFEVVGVDNAPQPNYPFEFRQANALAFLNGLLQGSIGNVWNRPDRGWYVLGDFDAIHASPPCPVHSSLNGWSGDSVEPDLIPQTRELLQATGLPYIIENVPGAPLEAPTRICGQALGLRVRRHRLFETNFPFLVPSCHHPEPPVIVVGGSIGRRVFDPRRKAIAPTFEEALEVMETPWMKERQEVVNAIPPRFTELIGHQLIQQLQKAAA